MLEDVRFVIGRWRMVHLLGLATLRSRYARSKFGQLWLSLSMLFMIVSVGMVWSLIWNMPLDVYLPYVGVGHIFFTFLSQGVNDSTGIFVADSRLYLNEPLPFMTSVAAHIYRSFIVFLHNVPTIFMLVLWSDSAHVTIDFLFPIAFLAMFIFLFFSSYIVATICTYYRDLIQIIGLLMQIAFLLTPVMWKTDVIPAPFQHYIFFNPFTAFLEAVRNPLIGMPVDVLAYQSISIWCLVTFLLAMLVYRRMNRNIIFWV